jgi:uncharacterized DUF497 family protein
LKLIEITYRWNEDKNELLMRERGLSFEMVVEALVTGGLLDNVPHPDSNRYPNQRVLQVVIDGYACAVPYVQDGATRFLKTIYRSRKVNRLHKEP